MTVYFTQNFDGVTAPALPAGWSTQIPGSSALVTSTTKARSGANSLKFSGTGTYNFAYVPGTLDTAGRGAVQLEAWLLIDSQTAFCIPELNLLCTSTPTAGSRFATCVTLEVGLDNSVVRLSGSAGFFSNEINAAGLFSANAWYRAIFQAVPSLTQTTLDLIAYVQRDSDGAWLGPSGTWGPAGGQQMPCMIQRYGPTFLAAWRTTGTYACLGCYNGSASIAYFDDVTFSTATFAGVAPATPAAAPSDEVELIANATVSTDAGTTGNGVAHITDGDPATYYESSATNAYAGVDLGSGKTCRASRYRFMPAWGLYTGGAPYSLASLSSGFHLEGSNDGSTWNQQGCLPLATHQHRGAWQEVPLDTQATSYRYYRVRGTRGQSLGVGEFAVCGSLALLSGSPSYRPCQPVLSPAAGKFANGTTWTASNPASKPMYYLTGTTQPADPTNLTGTLYTGANALPSNQVTFIKIVTYDAGAPTPLSRVTAGVFRCPQQIVPDTKTIFPNTAGNADAAPGCFYPEDVYDDHGNPLTVAYSNVYSEGGTYYRFGGPNYDQPVSGGDLIQTGVRSYTSTDLYNWTPHQDPLVPPTPGDWALAGAVRLVIGKHSSPADPSRAYVGWARAYNPGSPSSTSGASCSAPALGGPWKWETLNVSTDQGDSTLFFDDDGAWYFVFGDNALGGVSVWKLDATVDHTALETQVTSGGGQNFWNVGPGTAREGVAMLYRYHGGVKYYYLIRSDLQNYGALPGRIYYSSATSLGGLVGATEHDIYANPSGNTPDYRVPAGTGAGGADVVARINQATCAFALNGDPLKWVLGNSVGAFGVSPLDPSVSRDAWWPLTTLDFPSAGVLALRYAGKESWDTATAYPTFYTLTTAAGSFALTGKSAGFQASYPLAAARGSFTLTGAAASFLVGHGVAAAAGAFTLTGRSTVLVYAHKLMATVGNYTLTGAVAPFNMALQTAPATFTLTGLFATLGSFTLQSASGSLVVTGRQVSVSRNRSLTPAIGSFVVVGLASSLHWSGETTLVPPITTAAIDFLHVRTFDVDFEHNRTGALDF